jgi:hypothetical protein
MENEVEDILDFKLTKEVNDVSRHATIIQLKGVWWSSLISPRKAKKI